MKKMKKCSTEQHLQWLIELKKSILEGNIDKLKQIESSIASGNQLDLKECFENPKNPIRNTNLIILACKHNQLNILEYLLGINSKSTLLRKLHFDTNKWNLLPHVEDETHHNAFYYAIRSGNVKLLETLITQWPGKYFDNHTEELEEILSIAYEESKLENVSLSGKIEVFVEDQLLDLRFYSKTFKQQASADTTNNIKERIKLTLENISHIIEKYSNVKEVDEAFLFIAKFIAQNLHILKRKLKLTYSRLPWEEIEFCLVIFISTHTKIDEKTLFCRIRLDKNKILGHLEVFAGKLKDELNNNIEITQQRKLNELPSIEREKVVADIVYSCPKFAELYNDYYEIRDMYSLEIISGSIKLSYNADPKQREGQLVITRVLQVIGEHMKNTLESPKLSSATNELLLLSLPKNTRKIITNLRDSLSHGYSLSKRIEIEENRDDTFFVGVLNDIQKIGSVILNILGNTKIRTIRMLLKKIISAENAAEINEILSVCDGLNIFNHTDAKEIHPDGEGVIENLVKKLSNSIPDQTNHEKKIFNQINFIINSEKKERKANSYNYFVIFTMLKCLKSLAKYEDYDHNTFRGIKFAANQLLEACSDMTESSSFIEIIKLSINVFQIASSRLHGSRLTEIRRLVLYIAELGTDENLTSIQGFREKLLEKNPPKAAASLGNEKNSYALTKETYKNQLSQKLSELKTILNKNMINRQLGYNYSSYRDDKTLQAVVEMLVLDVMSILEVCRPGCLENNFTFFDENSSSLTGKYMRNYLSHNDALIRTLLFDPTTTIVLNASKLITENMIEIKKKIGRSFHEENLKKLKERYERGLAIIDNKKRMFAAFQNGDLEEIKNCIKDGADINAQNINQWSVAHFAAMGTSVEAIKFILAQNISLHLMDIDGQSPLQIAVLHGRARIVKYLLVELRLDVNVIDVEGKTPLHVAAERGYTDIVEILLKNKANKDAKDMKSYPPVLYAVENNNKNIVEILLREEEDVDTKQVAGYTLLHMAAEKGFVELVNLLIQKGAKVNAINDNGGIPLHTAALNGHLEVVKALISKGSEINAQVVTGCTPLHYATENNHQEIARLLLKHGAKVNFADKSYFFTPLHDASGKGHKEMVEILLRNKADVSAVTVYGLNPLHLASKNGHIEIVEMLLKYGASIHAKAKSNITPLHFAAKGGYIEVVKVLLKNNADPNARNSMNATPLHEAATKCEAVAELLINSKAKVNVQDIDGEYPLHEAATHGRTNVISLLIKNKAEVNARNNDGCTPLYLAARGGHKVATNYLIENGAQINIKDNYNFTPLEAAIARGHKDIVELLVKNNAEVNVINASSSPLHMAINIGNKEIIEILIRKDADVNVVTNSITPVCLAIKNNNKPIVELLLANGANVNGELGYEEPLKLSVNLGYSDIVDVLLRHKAALNIKHQDNLTLLHIAAKNGNKKILNALVTRGADVNATTDTGMTTLHFAAISGHEEIINILLAKGANVNSKSVEGTPLHVITKAHDNSKLVEILLSHGADINIKDDQGNTPLEIAVANNHLETVKTLISKINKENHNSRLLHISAYNGHLEIVEFLVNAGFDSNAKDSSGLKPIHIAAIKGFKDIVAFFVNKGFNVNDVTTGTTLLHYSMSKGHLETAKYLISQGADVNAQDTAGRSPLHVAAKHGFKSIIELLLENGAFYNITDKLNQKPLQIATGEDVLKLLLSTKNLFKAIKENSFADVEKCIREGAYLNAKNSNDLMPLHHAAWKGYKNIVEILLKNNANPNATIKGGCTPLHYAAKYSNAEIVKILLSNGAIYNCVNESQATPLNFAKHKTVVSLLTLVTESFTSIQSGTDSSKVVRYLKKISDIDTAKAIMNARNTENKTLIVAAIHSGFPNIEDLKYIMQADLPSITNAASYLCLHEKYEEALKILEGPLKRTIDIFGLNNPATWDLQKQIAQIYYKQQKYQAVVDILEKIYEKQEEMFGAYNEDALNTKSFFALVLHRQGKDNEALKIYQTIYINQLKLHSPTHSDVLNTELHMALVLDRLKRYEEALAMNYEVFEKRKQKFGPFDPCTLSTRNNIAMVLNNQGKHDEALKLYREVYELRMRTLGPGHSDTLRTLHNMVMVLQGQGKSLEALKALEDVFERQRTILGPDHIDTLNTQNNIGRTLFSQGKLLAALKHFRESFEKRKAILGESNPDILMSQTLMSLIYKKLKLSDIDDWVGLSMTFQSQMNIAASKGDEKNIQHLINIGTSTNEQDSKGWSPLYYAVFNGHLNVVKILLSNDGNAFQVTSKGNTPLHIAASKGYKEIAQALIQHVDPKKSLEFINAQTTGSGSTSLHVASENGFLEIVIILLKHGATYEIENKLRKKPLDISKHQNIVELLKLIDNLFKDAKNGRSDELVSKIQTMNNEKFLSAINARNSQGLTLIQVALFNINKNTASQLLRLLKERQQ